MSLDLSSDTLYQVFVTLFELIKPKRGTHPSRWGKWEGNHFANNGSCLSLPLNIEQRDKILGSMTRTGQTHNATVDNAFF